MATATLINSAPVGAALAPSLTSHGNIQYALTLIRGALAGAPEQIRGLVDAVKAGQLTPQQALGLFAGGIEQLIGAIKAGPPTQTPVVEKDLKVDTLGDGDTNKITQAGNSPGAGVLDGNAAAEGPEETPKKHRQRLTLTNIDVFNLAGGDKQDAQEVAGTLGSDSGAAQASTAGVTTTTTPKHGLGFGKTPVQDLVKRVLGGRSGNDNDDDGPAAGADDPAPAAAAS